MTTTSHYTIDDLSRRIRKSIEEELRVSSAGIPFKVSTVHIAGGILTLELESMDIRRSLDETMDEGTLGWKAEASGFAEIISVLPEVSCIHALLTAGRPPLVGQIVYVNPARFLEPLLELWGRENISAASSRWYFDLESNDFDGRVVPDHSPIPMLRPAQRKAFGLVGWNTSYLWGPPGTGKTATVGWLIASYLRDRPGDRVLLLSTTNVAVDLAILSVDDALPQSYKRSTPSAYLRFGSRFDPMRYSERRHLIPLRDKSLLERYNHHLHSAPDPAEAAAYRLWKEQLNKLRQEIRDQSRQFLAAAKLAAMTATYATFQFDDLASVGPYDLVVFDEASQLGKAHAMTLSRLGRRVLFAGDPKQLSPIVQSKDPDAINWLGRSPFEWSSRSALKPATCMLNEQWRMAEPISGAVSDFFYESQLRVAEPALKDPKWKEARNPQKTKLLDSNNIVLLDVGAEARPAHRFIGYVCPESAEMIAALVVDLFAARPEDKILVLTPFRAQRREIQKQLQGINAPVSLVSTVHRAQGSQRRVVIFDPVRPSAEFVRGSEGMRLVNVAISRAESQLIVLMQDDWKSNPALAFLASRFGRTPFDSSHLESLLSKKLPRIPKSAPEPRVTPKTIAKSLTLAEQFQQELLAGLRNRPNTKTSRTHFFLDLASRVKYKKLSYSEKDEALASLQAQLPPTVGS